MGRIRISEADIRFNVFAGQVTVGQGPGASTPPDRAVAVLKHRGVHVPLWIRRQSWRKKTDATEHPKGSNASAYSVASPPTLAGLLFIQSSVFVEGPIEHEHPQPQSSYDVPVK